MLADGVTSGLQRNVKIWNNYATSPTIISHFYLPERYPGGLFSGKSFSRCISKLPHLGKHFSPWCNTKTIFAEDGNTGDGRYVKKVLSSAEYTGGVFSWKSFDADVICTRHPSTPVYYFFTFKISEMTNFA